MNDKKVVLVTGPPGAGKTHHIENDETLKRMLRYDTAQFIEYGEMISDRYYRWVGRLVVMLCEAAVALATTADSVVIEAVAGPESKSLQVIRAWCRWIVADLEVIIVMAPYNVCLARVENDPDRVKVLNGTYNKFQEE